MKRLLDKVQSELPFQLTDSLPDQATIDLLFEWLQALSRHHVGLVKRATARQRRNTLRSVARYRLCKDPTFPVPWIVDVANVGEPTRYTADLGIIDARVREYWSSIWTQPPWDRPDLEQLLLDRAPEGPPCQLDPIRPEDVSSAISQAKGVGGADGWSVDELKSTGPLHAQLAEIYNLMESAGVVPSACRVGDVTLVPKSDKSLSYKEMRPITVLSVFHRVYAAIRLRKSLFQWQESLIQHMPCMACRPNASTKDLVWPLAVQLERSLLEGQPLVGASYDLSKAFDTLPLGSGGVLWRLADKMKFPQAISTLLRDQYSGMERRFKFHGFLGEAICFWSLRCPPRLCVLHGAHERCYHKLVCGTV